MSAFGKAMTSALYNSSASAIPLHVFRTSLAVRDAAERWFAPTFSSIKFLLSAPSPESIPELKSAPEVIFIGRANVGKSTLINYICGNKDLAVSSKKPGRTQALNFFGLQRLRSNQSSRYDMVLVDAPGYGQRGRPEWGALFDHYIRTRDSLRCIYILINAQHGVTEFDKMMLRFLHLESAKRPFRIQPIITKTDKLQVPKLTEMCKQAQYDIQEVSPKSLPPIFAAGGSRDKRRYGRVDVRGSIVEQCGLADKKKEK